MIGRGSAEDSGLVVGLGVEGNGEDDVGVMMFSEEVRETVGEGGTRGVEEVGEEDPVTSDTVGGRSAMAAR